MPFINDFCQMSTKQKTRCKFPVTAIRNGKTYCTRHDPLLKRYHEEAMFKAADLIRSIVEEELNKVMLKILIDLGLKTIDKKEDPDAY